MAKEKVDNLLARLQGVDATKVLGYGLAGLVGAVVVVVGNHFLSDDIEADLDPPSPCMKKLGPDLHIIMLRFMGSFYKLCPKEEQEEYKRLIKGAIRYMEGIMVIETEMLSRQTQLNFKDKVFAKAMSLEAMKKLREAERLFSSMKTRVNVKKASDAVQYQIANHLQNISACFE